jgi:hypothetical protein
MAMGYGKEGICGITLEPSIPLNTHMPSPYTPPKSCGARGTYACFEPTTCCCAKEILGVCQDFVCCASGVSCNKGKGCNSF